MTRLTTLALAGAAVLVAVPAFAADLPAPVPTAPVTPAPVIITPAPAVFNWSGLYVGGNVGYAFGGSDVVGFDATPGGFVGDAGELDLEGFFGGVQAGYNFQFGNFVAGIEADFQLADINDDITSTLTVGPDTVSGELDWFGTVRGRLGYALDRTLIYATGGLAYGHYEVTSSTAGGIVPGVSTSDEETMFGFAVGAGVEHAFTDNLSARLEYLYVDLGAETFDVVGGTTQGSPNFHSVRLGLNYRF